MITQNPEWHLFGRNFDAGAKFRALFLVWAHHLRCKKTSKCEFTKNQRDHQVDRQKIHVVWHIVIEECASYLRKMASKKLCIFRNFEPPPFCTVCSTSAARSSKKITSQRASFQFFGTPWPILMLTIPEIFGTGMFDRPAGFHHVLSVFVVLSVSVESARECQMTCPMRCFCAVSLSGTMRSAMSVLLEETAFGGHASL